MRDYNRQIDFDSLNGLVNLAFEEGAHVEINEGVLNDTYIIYNEDVNVSFVGVKPRKYIVLYPKFASAWHNTFHVLMTDEESKIEKFLPKELTE